VSYHWDNAGNRTIVGETGLPAKYYTPNSYNQYTAITGGPITNGGQHEISSYKAMTYKYYGDTYLSTVSATINGTSTKYELFYDALGRCVERKTNGAPKYYLYDGEHWIVELRGDGTVYSNALYGLGIDEILARGVNGKAHIHLPDRNGNTAVITDFMVNGTAPIREQYRYDAFGAPTFMNAAGGVLTSGASAIENRFLFTGREYNSDFGFYEYRARAYHPGLGRFMSEDPKLFDAGDYNLFRYCGNDPLDRTDPMGLEDMFTTHAEDIAGRDAAIGAYNHAQTISRSTHTAPKDYGQGVRTGADGKMQPNGKWAVEKPTTTNKFEDRRLKRFQAKSERISTGETHKITGHVHNDVSGNPRSSPDASREDLQAARTSKVYRVNESNPSVIWRAVPQTDGSNPVDRPFDAATMKPVDPSALNQKAGL
jgi:RHS repeat-associated protein